MHAISHLSPISLPSISLTISPRARLHSCGYTDAPEALLCWHYVTEAACLGETLPSDWKAEAVQWMGERVAETGVNLSSGPDLWPCVWNDHAEIGYRPCGQRDDPHFRHRQTMHNNQYAVLFELHCLVYWIAALWASDSFLTANERAKKGGGRGRVAEAESESESETEVFLPLSRSSSSVEA